MILLLLLWTTLNFANAHENITFFGFQLLDTGLSYCTKQHIVQMCTVVG